MLLARGVLIFAGRRSSRHPTPPGRPVQRSRAAALALILAMPPEPRPENPISVERLETLMFADVGFQHQSASQPALQGVLVRRFARRNSRLCRASGAGKTTLLKFWSGFTGRKRDISITTGREKMRLPSTACVREFGSLRRMLSFFSGWIRERLLFVRPEATDAECMDVLRQASVESLLARAEHGLDTVIGEGGIKVSGGEKQRLSIARALLRRPQLLVFDEATSSLDSLTEEEISHTIRDVAATRDAITILIAHRLSTVLHADRIYVLERGRIIESGRHEELIDGKGLYYAMWRQQVGEGRAPHLVGAAPNGQHGPAYAPGLAEK